MKRYSLGSSGGSGLNQRHIENPEYKPKLYEGRMKAWLEALLSITLFPTFSAAPPEHVPKGESRMNRGGVVIIVMFAQPVLSYSSRLGWNLK